MRPPLFVLAAALTLGVAMSTLPAQMASAQSPSTSVLVPANGTTVSGSRVTLDASASAGVNRVQFELTGGSLSHSVIATATPTYYGWIAVWNSTTVTDGTYTLQSIATSGGSSATSPGISITVTAPPTTSMLIPSSGATLSGTTYLDASATNATSVEFLLFGGSYGYNAPVLCTATPTYYGWLCSWNTTTVPNGSYALVSYASGAGGSGFSSPISITVNNLLSDLAGPFVGTFSGLGDCSFVGATFTAMYSNSFPVGTVNLQMSGCYTLISETQFDYSGTFTFTTNVGTLSGTVGGQFFNQVTSQLPPVIEPSSASLQLAATSGTGLFTGTTGTLNVSLGPFSLTTFSGLVTVA